MQEMPPVTLTPHPDAQPTSSRQAARFPFTWIPVVIFCCITLPLILLNCHASRPESDQSYHLRAIQQFCSEWPCFNFQDYASATTPGYHVALATVAKLGFSSVTSLRLAGWFFSLGLIIELTRHTKPLGGWTAACICMPFVTSLYVVSSAGWILPDNLGWWGVLALLAITFRPPFNYASIALSGVILFALVWVRQVHLWTIPAMMLAAWWGTDNHSAGRRKRLTLMGVATLPAIISVAWFAWLWHGLMPPSVADEIRHAWYSSANLILEGPNFATPATILAVFGCIAPFFCKFLRPVRSSLWAHRSYISLGFILGVLAAILPRSDYSYGLRSSGIWNIAAHFPAPLHRSILIMCLAGVGGALLFAWCIALDTRSRWLWGVCWAAFIFAQMPNPSAFQRYYEPFCLMILALTATNHRNDGNDRQVVWIGPVLLSILLATVTSASLR